MVRGQDDATGFAEGPAMTARRKAPDTEMDGGALNVHLARCLVMHREAMAQCTERFYETLHQLQDRGLVTEADLEAGSRILQERYSA